MIPPDCMYFTQLVQIQIPFTYYLSSQPASILCDFQIDFTISDNYRVGSHPGPLPSTISPKSAFWEVERVRLADTSFAFTPRQGKTML